MADSHPTAADKPGKSFPESPRPDPEALTVKDLANGFLNRKRNLLDAGEFCPRTFRRQNELSAEPTANDTAIVSLNVCDLSASLRWQLPWNSRGPRMARVPPDFNHIRHGAHDKQRVE